MASLHLEHIDAMLRDVRELLIAADADTALLETYHKEDCGQTVAIRIVLCDSDEQGDPIKRVK